MGHLVPGKPPSTGRLELEGQALDGVWRGEGRAGAGARPARSRERVPSRRPFVPGWLNGRGTSVVVTGGLARPSCRPARSRR